MSEKFTLTTEAEKTISSLGGAELVVGVASLDRLEDTREAIATARAGLALAFPASRTVVVHAHCGSQPAEPAEDNGVPVINVTCRGPAAGASPRPAAAVSRAVLEAGHRLGARATAMIGAEVSSLEPDWIGRLLRPVVEQGCDFVAPWYHRPAYSGALNSGLVYPLVRTIFGRRVRFPLGSEFAGSARLVERHLRRDPRLLDAGPVAIELQLLTDAVAGGLVLGQAVLGRRTLVAGDGQADLGTVLLDVLAMVFGEMERTSTIWQKIRGSAPVDRVGNVPAPPLEPVTLDSRRLVEAYRLGQQNLREVWGLVHSPGTLVELKKLAQMPDATFAMPDRLWARIVFDCSLAFRTRIMSREHLIGAFAPLYLGWLGSLHTELGETTPERMEDRIEQLCLQFEAEKPYLISRWRWPDRFNP